MLTSHLNARAQFNEHKEAFQGSQIMKILSEHHFHTAFQILFYITDLFALQEIPNEEG
jgi:predicted nucleic acid binding AN1-type Zn finger protein